MGLEPTSGKIPATCFRDRLLIRPDDFPENSLHFCVALKSMIFPSFVPRHTHQITSMRSMIRFITFGACESVEKSARQNKRDRVMNRFRA